MIEDKALEIITRGPITWDGLRAELGCSSGELDTAIRSLETTKAITRDRGRLRLVSSNGLSKHVAEAQASTAAAVDFALESKTCKRCQASKPRDDFSNNTRSPDGKQSWCKACHKTLDKARRKPAGELAALPPPAAAIKEGAARTPVVILHLPDGIRVGPAAISAAGVMQMPYHVDLTGEQLDEICTWWTNCKRGAA